MGAWYNIHMNKKLLWAGLLGLASVVVGLVPSVMPVPTQADVWPRAVGLVRMALLIIVYALMARSDVKGARWIYGVMAFVVASVALSAGKLIGLSSVPRWFSPIFGSVDRVASLAVWFSLVRLNAGRLRTVFVAQGAAAVIGFALSIVFYAQSVSQGGSLQTSWQIYALRFAGLLAMLLAYFGWLYLVYAAQPEVAPESGFRRVAWPWRAFLVTLPLVLLLGLGQKDWPLFLLIIPIGVTFGFGGPLVGAIVGWGAYLALAIFILHARRLSSLLSLLGVFVLLVLLNIAGCGAMIGGSWN